MPYYEDMSNSISDLLSSKNFAEPPEIRQIKDFVQAAIGIEPAVSMTTETFVIRLNSAAAAGALRTRIYELQKQMDTPRRLVIRIG